MARMAKAERDARNPIAEAAGTGLMGGINRAVKNIDETKQAGLKYALEGPLQTKQRRQQMAAKILEENDIVDSAGNIYNTPEVISKAFNALTEGTPFEYGFKAKRQQRTQETAYERRTGELQAEKEFPDRNKGKETQDKTISNLNATIAILQDKWNMLSKQQVIDPKTGKSSVDNSAQMELIDNQINELTNKVSELQGGGRIERNVIEDPGTPEVVNKFWGIDALARNTPAVPPSKKEVFSYVPPGQAFNRKQNAPAATPQPATVPPKNNDPLVQRAISELNARGKVVNAESIANIVNQLKKLEGK
jgi:hypothetical protein